MSKILLIIIFVSPLFSAISWDSEHIFYLKKDEIGSIYFYETGKKKEKNRYIFHFRWTLHDGKKVIVLSNYRDFPRQHTLYFKSKLNNFRQTLLNSLDTFDKKKSYLLLQMDRFNKKTKEISFLVFIHEKNQRLKIKYIDPKRIK